ncbi:thioredoxin-like protein [Panaeolus papilionaceus]|nr:thioredoxin-like protein [Panaeolus papilionaceus]
MFNSFKRKLPEISIFHHPSSPPSTKALALLKSSLQGPYPPTDPANPPLTFDLSVVENPPTEDQLNTIMQFSPRATNPAFTFLSAFPGSSESGGASTVKEIVKLAEKNPKALKYPIVVDWGNGNAAVGDVEGVKRMLEEIRKRRDGEVKGEEVDQPKGWFM